MPYQIKPIAPCGHSGVKSLSKHHEMTMIHLELVSLAVAIILNAKPLQESSKREELCRRCSRLPARVIFFLSSDEALASDDTGGARK